MDTHTDFITGSEFSRWTTELTRQLTANAGAVESGLGRIERHLAEINGRTRKNTEAIAVMERELAAIKSEDAEIEHVVADIKAHGCAQLSTHETVLRDLGWTTKKKAGVAGGLVGIGALAWPAVQELAAALHAGLDWLAKQ